MQENQTQQTRVATADEVLEYLTRVLRGEEGGGGQATMKAAELLGKRLGLFNERTDDLPPPVIVDDVDGAAEEMLNGKTEDGENPDL